MLFAEKSSGRVRLLRWLVFALSPLALALGIWLMLKTDPNTAVEIQLDRAAAIARAREVAVRSGVETNGWTAGHRIEASNDRHFYYRLHANEQTAKLRRLAPEVQVNVILIAPDGAERVRVWLAPDGALLGYAHTLPPDRAPQDAGAPASRLIADDAMRRFTEASAVAVAGEPEIDEDRDGDSIKRTYAYPLDTAALPGLNARRAVTVVGDTITGQETTFAVDEDYAGDNLINHHIATQITSGLYGIVIFALCLYALYRYFRLTQQKEVPHARTILLCVLAGAAFMLSAYQTEFYLFDFPFTSGVAFWSMVIGVVVSNLMLGLVIGIAYASGEGDVRAAYPGKLTSLDALLTGRVFSRNVAGALLAGAALGAWGFFAERLVLLPFTLRADGGQGLAVNTWKSFGGSITGLIVLVQPLFGSVMLAVFGVLLPLALLRGRRARTPKTFFVLLALLCLLVNLVHFTERPYTPAAGALVALVVVAVSLAAFFLFDLLTVMVATTALALTSWGAYLIPQSSSSLRQAGLLIVAVTLLLLVAEAYFFLRGRLYAEADVRPLYARHLAERVQLQAEESAAREAQVRLMPQELPTRANLELAAVCHPAHTVGGDFYDLFPLDDERLCIFVAEGGGGGLGSALTIAFAKGFLMPRVAAGAAPADIIFSLQTQLAPMLLSNEELTIAFAVIDARRRTVAYARTGEYPRVHVAANAGEARTSRSAAVAETLRAWRVADEAGNDARGDCTIREATLQLAEGDAVLFFTDGIGKALAIEHSSPDKFAHAIIKRNSRKAATSLQDRLGKTMATHARRARRINLDDDLTAVVIRFERNAPQDERG